MQSNHYIAAKVREHRARKRSAGECGQSGCHVISREMSLCNKHMKEATARTRTRRLLNRERKSFMTI